jgi:hypothetical protein
MRKALSIYRQIQPQRRNRRIMSNAERTFDGFSVTHNMNGSKEFELGGAVPVTLGHAWVTRKSNWHKGVTLVTQKRWVRWFGAREEIAACQQRFCDR